MWFRVSVKNIRNFYWIFLYFFLSVFAFVVHSFQANYCTVKYLCLWFNHITNRRKKSFPKPTKNKIQLKEKTKPKSIIFPYIKFQDSNTNNYITWILRSVAFNSNLYSKNWTIYKKQMYRLYICSKVKQKW